MEKNEYIGIQDLIKRGINLVSAGTLPINKDKSFDMRILKMGLRNETSKKDLLIHIEYSPTKDSLGKEPYSFSVYKEK
jgi:hypothetical protein|tara:strand:+ start:3072 stop:3305 length:234 start_codon:yes stop_codon:yes gene_type:complete